MEFPRHEGGLYLTHNDHKAAYETVESRLSCFDSGDDWVNEEQKKKALEKQEYWQLQWYPDTPISSYSLLAYDLDVLLEEALKVAKGKR
jgi:hypothetical protein